MPDAGEQRDLTAPESERAAIFLFRYLNNYNIYSELSFKQPQRTLYSSKGKDLPLEENNPLEAAAVAN